MVTCLWLGGAPADTGVTPIRCLSDNRYSHFVPRGYAHRTVDCGMGLQGTYWIRWYLYSFELFADLCGPRHHYRANDMHLQRRLHHGWDPHLDGDFHRGDHRSSSSHLAPSPSVPAPRPQFPFIDDYRVRAAPFVPVGNLDSRSNILIVSGRLQMLRLFRLGKGKTSLQPKTSSVGYLIPRAHSLPTPFLPVYEPQFSNRDSKRPSRSNVTDPRLEGG